MQLVSIILFILFLPTLGSTIFPYLVPLVQTVPFQSALGPTFFPLSTTGTNWEIFLEGTHPPGTNPAWCQYPTDPPPVYIYIYIYIHIYIRVHRLPLTISDFKNFRVEGHTVSN